MLKKKSSHWEKYYLAKEGKVSPLSKTCLELTKKTGIAYDLGCGAGGDSFYLSGLDWQVNAVDNEVGSINFIKSRMSDTDKIKLEQVSIHELRMKEADLVFASASLPFLNHDHFQEALSIIYKGLKNDGVFAGLVFGTKDDWANSDGMTFLSQNSFISMIDPYDILYFDEVIETRPSAQEELKQWHLYYFILRKLKS